MSRSREELRAVIMKEAGEVVEEMLDWHEASEQPNLVEMEELVLGLRQRLSTRMVELLVEEQETVHLPRAPICERCAKRMKYKGAKGRGVGSRLGELKVERSHYYCPRCKAGLFPPGQTIRR